MSVVFFLSSFLWSLLLLQAPGIMHLLTLPSIVSSVRKQERPVLNSNAGQEPTLVFPKPGRHPTSQRSIPAPNMQTDVASVKNKYNQGSTEMEKKRQNCPKTSKSTANKNFRGKNRANRDEEINHDTHFCFNFH